MDPADIAIDPDFQKYQKKVAAGIKSSKPLTAGEAEDALDRILSGQAAREQAAAFLVVERIKTETPDELVGFVRAARKFAARLPVRIPGLVDCAGPYDGSDRGPHIAPAVALICASAGVPCLLHGGDRLTPKHGLTRTEVLEALRVPTRLDPAATARLLEEVGVAFAHQEVFCPALFALRPLREAITVRTALHTVEKLLDFGGAEYLAIGVFHGGVMEHLAQTLAQLEYRRCLLVRGLEGSEEVWAGTRAHYCLIEAGNVTEGQLNPEALGLGPAEWPREPWEEDRNARLIEELVAGSDSPFREAVLLNAGLRLWLAEKVPDAGAGMELAAAALASGAPRERLEALRRFA